MSKQLLIYSKAVPVSAARHSKSSVEPPANYAFSAGVNAVPLMAVEFMRASSEYAIVFTNAGDDVAPAVVLGIKGDQNLYLTGDSQWKARYVPAFIRRYPFVFSSSADGKTLTLCIDESYPGLNTEGRGQRFFGDDGKPAPYVDGVLKFLREYQIQFERTKAFGKKLKEFGLLEPMEAQVVTPQGGKMTLSGFLAVSRTKLKALSGDQLASLAKTDELELIYLHLNSLNNFNEVKDRLIGALSANGEAVPAAAQ